MYHSAGLRIRCLLLTVLAITSPSFADGVDRKLAPVVDLHPRHMEAASLAPVEPKSLIVAAEAVPLPVEDTATPKQHDERGPAVRYATPFDPTRPTPHQHATARAEPASRVSTLAPVIRVYQPLAKTAQETIREADNAPAVPKPSAKQLAPSRPTLEPVYRSTFMATREDRLERVVKKRNSAMNHHDPLSARMIAALDSFTRPTTVPLAALYRNESPDNSKQNATNKPKLSGFIQVAERDPVAATAEQQKLQVASNLQQTDKVTRRSTPIIVAATQPVLQVSRPTTELNLTSEPAIKIETAATAKPVVPLENRLDIGAVLAKRNSPIVELAADPITQQASKAVTRPEPTYTSSLGPVLKLVEEATPTITEFLPQQPVAAEPLIQFADAEPLLAVLQPAPSPSDLPAPAEEPALTQEQLADLEEIEAFELDLKPIHALSARTKPEAGEMPKNYAAARFAREGAIAHTMGISRAQAETTMMWEAPAICHRPLYFEDINLERHGYKVPLIQPALSAAHFFGRVPLLPYMMVNDGPRNCQYTLGHYRPGDYAPYSLYIPRLRLDATAAELAVVAGVIFAFP